MLGRAHPRARVPNGRTDSTTARQLPFQVPGPGLTSELLRPLRGPALRQNGVVGPRRDRRRRGREPTGHASYNQIPGPTGSPNTSFRPITRRVDVEVSPSTRCWAPNPVTEPELARLRPLRDRTGRIPAVTDSTHTWSINRNDKWKKILGKTNRCNASHALLLIETKNKKFLRQLFNRILRAQNRGP